jgi:hypothetical protein
LDFNWPPKTLILLDHIISLGEDVWDRWTGFGPATFIEVSMLGQESEWSFICVLGYWFSFYAISIWNCSDSVVLQYKKNGIH